MFAFAPILVTDTKAAEAILALDTSLQPFCGHTFLRKDEMKMAGSGPADMVSSVTSERHNYPKGEIPTSAVGWTDNLILATDSYKYSHWKQYPKGTEYVYSYFESRGCDREGWNEVVFFGLQYFIKRYLMGKVITREKIDEAAELCAEHFQGDGLFYKEGFEYILEKHEGRLPICIKSLPEGMVVPTKTALFTMVNTDPKCFWLTNFLETLLVQVSDSFDVFKACRDRVPR
eukprot:Skav200532  [mRNA]  locus=scaffold3153:32181:39699:- [translate_table: standard]